MFLEPKFTIQQLIDRCKADERKAQELLYKQFAAKMLAVCMRYATDRMEAEDMLQNGFIRVFQKLADFPVQKQVHSLAVDPATHRVYAPEQEEDGRPVARMIVYEPVQPPGMKE